MDLVSWFTWRDAAGFVLTLVVAALIWQAGTNKEQAARRADHSVCVRIEALKVGFRDSLKRGLATLDQYAYYRDHPDEKADAAAEIRRQLRLYAPISC